MRITASRKTKGMTRLSVDFPRQGERITSPTYAVRVTAPADARVVEVSLDQGPWQPCRDSVGHWWYDWADYSSGEHEVIARIITRGGERLSCEPHEFFVDLEPHASEANA